MCLLEDAPVDLELLLHPGVNLAGFLCTSNKAIFRLWVSTLPPGLPVIGAVTARPAALLHVPKVLFEEA